MIKRISIIIAILLCIALCSCTLDSNTTLGENGEHLNEYLADVDGDYVGETNVIHDGYFDESSLRAAPYFDIIIDGVTILN